MSFPRYPKYKDSGVEWLGEVPEHWEVWKLSHAFTVIGSGTTPKTSKHEYYDNGTIPWINTGDLNDSKLFSCRKKVTNLAINDHSSLKLYPENSLLFAMYGATIGRISMLQFPATVNQACCVFGGESKILPSFMFYWFLGYRQQILSLATGGGQPNVSQDILRTLRAACPDEEEQSAIASFLDRETGKIDALVDEQRRLIELLKEKRQAVISHAVTKGLDPDVAMKDSGVEWLGEVPEHWEVVRLKRLWKIFDCKHVTAEYVDEGTPLASIREVQSRWVSLEHAKRTTDSFYELLIEGDRKPEVGDLIFSRNATVGEVAQVSPETPKFAMGQDVCLLRRRIKSMPPDFLQRMIVSSVVTAQLDLLMIGSTFKRINVDDIRSLQIPAPPIDEQVAIAEFVENQLQKYDDLIESSSYSITLLQERRTALISAAVTGKIDVRTVSETQTEPGAA
jgi:type I restriction enzyme, S subunit